MILFNLPWLRLRTLMAVIAAFLSASAFSSDHLPKDIARKLSAFNPVWDTASTTGSLESMPIGNGDITANVWVESEGDLMMYVGKSDTWSEATRLLKVGRLRISLSPNPFAKDTDFSQELNLLTGSIIIKAKGKADNVEIRIWADALNPAINVETDSRNPIDIKCTTELLRPTAVEFHGGGANPLASSFRGVADSPTAPAESSDVLASTEDQIRWYHRNSSSFFRTILEHQNVGELAEKYQDPYLGLTFGASVSGNDMKASSDSTLSTTRKVKKNLIRIVALTDQTDSVEKWKQLLDNTVVDVASTPVSTQWKRHCSWWNSFWDRSWIFLSGDDAAQKITEGYLLQRYMIACQSRGAYPVKFNGGSLTFDYKGKNGDYRNWGPGYWYQNNRLIYWPLTTSGDYEMKKPWFDMYMAMLPLQKDITKKYYGHDGAFFPETLNFFGGYIQDDWGWNNTGTASQTRWIRYHYESSLEMLAEMLNYYDYTRDTDFASSHIIPFATEVIRFYDRHWPTINQEYRFIPANSLEQYWDCLNPIDYISGLNFDIDELMRLTGDLASPETLEEWRRVKRQLHPLPKSEDRSRLTPAEEYGQDRNFENPQCYAIWPFKLFGKHQPEYDVALNTFRDRKFKTSNCWSQCAIQAARLGLAEEMPELLLHNANAKDPRVRFPAFWNPGSDYVPDFDNGGVLMLGAQTMLLDNLGDSIILLPALPENWEADFKLNAPAKTTIRGKAKGTAILSLDVWPTERRKDIIKR